MGTVEAPVSGHPWETENVSARNSSSVELAAYANV